MQNPLRTKKNSENAGNIETCSRFHQHLTFFFFPQKITNLINLLVHKSCKDTFVQKS